VINLLTAKSRIPARPPTPPPGGPGPGGGDVIDI
jgi:hypothetical protein